MGSPERRACARHPAAACADGSLSGMCPEAAGLGPCGPDLDGFGGIYRRCMRHAPSRNAGSVPPACASPRSASAVRRGASTQVVVRPRTARHRTRGCACDAGRAPPDPVRAQLGDPSGLDRGRRAAMIDRSLRRVRTDYLDLVQLHSPPREALDDGAALAGLLRVAGRHGSANRVSADGDEVLRARLARSPRSR